MRRALLTLGVAVALATGSARGDGPPSPPSSSSFSVLAPAEVWRAPAEGGLCLDRAGWTYTVEVRRYYETRLRITEQVAEEAGGGGGRGRGGGGGVGCAAGGAAAAAAMDASTGVRLAVGGGALVIGVVTALLVR
jgi:hypothetical protein